MDLCTPYSFYPERQTRGLTQRCVLLLFIALCWATSAAAAPLHYLVLQIDDNGSPRQNIPVTYYRLIDQPGAAVNSVATLTGRTLRNVIEAVDDNGATVALVSTAAHHEGARPRSVVLRVPEISDAVSVRYWDAGGRLKYQWPLKQLIGAARQRGTHLKGSGASGSSNNRVNILVMGDGYTAAQEQKFEQDAQRALDGFFGLEPYRSYRSLLSVETYFVASAQAGADHPGCFDVDPVAPLEVDTVFNATYCTADVDRLLTVDENAVARVASEASSNWDRAVVIVNDDRYGGSGGFFSVISTHPLSPELLIHEWGHSFSRLTDEYDDSGQSFTCSDKDVNAFPCEANATDEIDRSKIKWRHWIDPATEIPTTPNFANRDRVGLFEGARYQRLGMYRPIAQCAMRTLGRAFCPICAQTYVEILFDGGWGNGDRGISLIEPDAASPPVNTPVVAATGQPVMLSTQILVPDHGVEVQWMANGETLASTTVMPDPESELQDVTFSYRPVSPGQSEVILSVVDQSPFLAGALGPRQRLFRESWTVDTSGVALSGLWFDPASEGEGFNVIESNGSITVFYFGYATDGSRLWLVSNSVAGPVVPGQALALNLLSGADGTFAEPGAPEGLSTWGSMEFTLTDCTSGTVTLDGADGSKQLNVTRLAAVQATECPATL